MISDQPAGRRKRLIVRRRWEAFCGQSSADAIRRLRNCAERAGYRVDLTHGEASSLQTFMLGSSQEPVGTLRVSANPAFSISVIPATHDPVARTILRCVGGRGSVRTSYDLCFISIAPVTDNIDAVQSVMQSFLSRSSPPPWVIEHPRFKVSIGLQARTRRAWRRWMWK